MERQKPASELQFDRIVHDRSEAARREAVSTPLVSINRWSGHVFVCGNLAATDVINLLRSATRR